MNKPLVFSGYHAVAAILRHRPEAVLEFFVLDSRSDRQEPRLEGLCAQAHALGLRPQRMRREVMERHAGPQNQGVAVRARPRVPWQESQLMSLLDMLDRNPLLLILDGITDPHNLGACLRTADAVSVDAVIVPRRRACGLTPTACRAAAGAAESVTYVEVGNLSRVMDELRARGVWILGTARASNSERLTDLSVRGPLAVAMGAEGEGLRRLTREKCDVLVEIPMTGEVESLNVSVATAVTLYQVCIALGRFH